MVDLVRKNAANGGNGEAGPAGTLTDLGLIKPSFAANAGVQETYSTTENLVRSGTYTPTAIEIFNLDFNPTVPANSMIWSQVGRVVTCSGYLIIDATTINTATGFTLTLPVLPTLNFTASTEVSGLVCFSTSGLGAPATVGTVSASGSAKTVDVGFYATETAAGRNLFYQFQYVLK